MILASKFLTIAWALNPLAFQASEIINFALNR